MSFYFALYNGEGSLLYSGKSREEMTQIRANSSGERCTLYFYHINGGLDIYRSEFERDKLHKDTPFRPIRADHVRLDERALRCTHNILGNILSGDNNI